MYFDDQELYKLLEQPKENPPTELKRWIDPRKPADVAKIAKGCIALYNNDGGILLIGYKTDGTPDTSPPPGDIFDLFEQEKIQSIVQKYASITLAVNVKIEKRRSDEKSVVIIEVPSGVKTPVYASRQLRDDSTELIRANQVYVRSLNASHMVSTSEPRGDDWDRLVERCFHNRGIDIGHIIKRSFSNEQLGNLRDIIDQIIEPVEQDPLRAARDYLGSCLDYRIQSIKDSPGDPPEHGSYEVAVVVNGEIKSDLRADAPFLRLLDANNQRHTGWPPWFDSSNYSDKTKRPYYKDNALQALLVYLEPTAIFHSIDFWRIDPSGHFYLYRALEDDMRAESKGTIPLKYFDFGLATARVTEIISVSLSFAKAMSNKRAEGSITLLFRWSKLQNRELSSWANTMRYSPRGRISRSSEVESNVTVPLATPKTGICQYVREAVLPLWEVFGPHRGSGGTPGSGTSGVEEICKETLNRQL